MLYNVYRFDDGVSVGTKFIINCKKPAFAVEIQQSQKIYSQFTNQHSLLKHVQLLEKKKSINLIH